MYQWIDHVGTVQVRDKFDRDFHVMNVKRECLLGIEPSGPGLSLPPSYNHQSSPFFRECFFKQYQIIFQSDCHIH